MGLLNLSIRLAVSPAFCGQGLNTPCNDDRTRVFVGLSKKRGDPRVAPASIKKPRRLPPTVVDTHQGLSHPPLTPVFLLGACTLRCTRLGGSLQINRTAAPQDRQDEDRIISRSSFSINRAKHIVPNHLRQSDTTRLSENTDPAQGRDPLSLCTGSRGTCANNHRT